MNAAFVWAAAIKDLRRRARDPIALVLWLGIPLVIVSLILLAFGGSDTTPVAKVLVVDRDQGLISRFLIDALRRSPVIDAETADSTEARARIDAGDATAMLTIPKGFGERYAAGDSVRLGLVTNPSERILPEIVEENLEMLGDAGFYLQRLFGDELQLFVGGPPQGQFGFEQGAFTSATGNINARITHMGPYLQPPAIALDTQREVEDEGDQLGLGALFFPGVLFMALLFMASGMASDVWQEAEQGTLRRAMMTPQRITDVLAGKLLAGAILIAIVCSAALAVGAWAFTIPIAHVPLGLLWATFSGTVFLACLILIQLHASSARTAGTLTTMILFPLLMVGGSFFPFENMRPVFAAVGRWTPNGWAVTQLKAILWGGADPTALGLAFAGLTAVGLLVFLIAARRLRHGFVTS